MCFADWPDCVGFYLYRTVAFDDEVSNLPPNSYRTLVES